MKSSVDVVTLTDDMEALSAENAELKASLDKVGSVSRPKPVTVVSPWRPPKASTDATMTGETGASLPAEFKLPPPTRKRKITVEFPDDFGSAGAPQHQLWPEVDRLWMLVSRERQETLSPVAATV